MRGAADGVGRRGVRRPLADVAVSGECVEWSALAVLPPLLPPELGSRLVMP